MKNEVYILALLIRNMFLYLNKHWMWSANRYFNHLKEKGFEDYEYIWLQWFLDTQKIVWVLINHTKM